MIKELFNKYKNIIMYLFFGVCTTLVNIVSYYIFSHILNFSVMSSTIIAWILAVLFAYVTNRKWVFESKAKTKKEIINEIVSFFSCRLATGIVDWLGMYILVEKIGLNDVVIKIIINIVVIILNYVASKLIVFNNKKKSFLKIDKKDLIIFASFLVVTFIFLSNSPLHIWDTGEGGMDSSVFRTIGMMMKNGYMPYLNSFDHKGPLLFLYNFFGGLINGQSGVWYIEFISLYISICYFFKIARLRCNRILSYIVTIIASTMLIGYFDGGNLTEEYALPFIVVSLYIFLDYVFNNNVDKKRLVLCGLSMGGVLLLRPNMIGTWIVFCIYILIDCIRKKKYQELKSFILYFLIGIAIIIIPVLIWLGINGALSDFFNAYITFNFNYAANYSKIRLSTPTYVNLITSIGHYVKEFIPMSSIIISIYMIKEDKKNIVILLYILAVIGLTCMSGMHYNHYYIVLVPTIIFPLALFFEQISIFEKKNKSNIFSLTIIILVIANIIIPGWRGSISKTMKLYANRNDKTISEEISKVADIVKKETNDKDKISVYGSWDIIYLVSNRLHATKYSYQYPITKVSSEIENEYFEELDEEKPKVIVIQKKRIDDRMKEFLDKNNYSLIYIDSDDFNTSNLVYRLN